MMLARRVIAPLGAGFLVLVLLAAAGEARTNFDEKGGLTFGLRGGGILPSSDLDGVLGVHGATFLRYGVVPKLQLELGVGYGRYTTEDLAYVDDPATANPELVILDPTRTRNYGTDLSYVQLRLLVAPVTYQRWAPFLYGGAGYTYFNVDQLTPRRGTFDGIGRTLGIPLGLGARYELTERAGLEGSLGYAFTMSDRIDEKKDGGGKDNYFEMMLGLTYDLRVGQYAERVLPPPPVVVREEAVDSDSDGLTDDEERTRYFTNPLMADSDADGLSDGEEVHVYRTNPNKADSDGGGVQDGAEVARGTDPLDPADDVEKPAVVPEKPIVRVVEYQFPTVYFPTGGYQLTAADRAELDAAARVLVDNPGVRLYVRGHADASGHPDANLLLSWRRAYAVKEYLAGKGVQTWRLTAKAYGDTQPVASNATPEGRAKNRRTELEQIK